MTAPSRKEAGFSLVEVLIATCLLATALASLATLFVVSVNNTSVARHGTVAAVLAGQKLEQLRADARLPLSPVNTLQVSTDGYMDYPSSHYIRRWFIEPIPDSNACVVQVLVTRRLERGAADQGAVDRAPEEARVITVMRRAP